MEPSGGRTAEAKIGQPSKDRRDAAGILTRIHALEAPLRLVTYSAVRDRSRHGDDDVVALGEHVGARMHARFWFSTWMLVRTAGWIILLHLIEITIWALFYAWDHGTVVSRMSESRLKPKQT